MAANTFDILPKPPPDNDNKGWKRWFYKVAEILNGGIPGSSTVLSVPATQNTTGLTIKKGELCGFGGVSNKTIDIRLFIADGTQYAYSVLGLASENIVDDGLGYLIYYGEVTGIDTSAWNVGDILFASPTAAGKLTNVMPIPPNVRVIVGTVLVKSTNGTVFVRIYPQLRPSYGTFASLVNQQAPVANTAYILKFEVTASSNGIQYNTGTGEFTVGTSAQYIINSSIQIGSTTNSVRTIVFWLVVNGIARQGTTRGITLSDSSVITMASISYNPILLEGDHVQIEYAVSATGPFIKAGTNVVPSPASNSATIVFQQLNI